MAEPKRNIGLWIKLGLIGLLVLYVAVFLAVNSQRSVAVWVFFGVQPEVNLLVLSLGAALVTALVLMLGLWAWRSRRHDRPGAPGSTSK
jgi:uncharacterized integral membrane protein